MPSGDRTMQAFGSGIEWVSVISSIENGPTSNLPINGTSIISISVVLSENSSLDRSNAAVNGVA